jgi:OFA family oxalate/formate antiporter-like MFS transporter
VRARSVADFPFSPRRLPFFYGWIILAAGTVGVIMSVPGQTVGVSVFTDHLLSAVGISRVALSLAYMAGTIAGALLLPLAGRLYDRLGARLLAPLAALLLGCGLLLLSGADRVRDFLGGLFAFLSPDAAAFVVTTCCFFLIRFSGQGTLTLVSRNMVMKWFDRRRGLANAFLGVFMSLGFSSAPLVLNMLIRGSSWRGAWRLLALVLASGFTVFALLLFRDNPQACGLVPDGGPARPRRRGGGRLARGAAGALPGAPPPEMDLREARKTLSFWAFTLVLVMFSTYSTALTFHVLSLFAAAGMSNEAAVSIFLPASAVAVLLNFGGSWLSDYIRLKYLLILMAAGLLLSQSACAFLAPGLPVRLLIAGNGIASGMFGVLSALTWPRFYGTRHLGAVSGFAMGWLVAGSAMGPYLFSQVFALSGSYRGAALACAAVTLVLLGIAFRADSPAERGRAAAAGEHPKSRKKIPPV